VEYAIEAAVMTEPRLIPPEEIRCYFNSDGTITIRWEWQPGHMSFYNGEFVTYKNSEKEEPKPEEQ
jgi:hypothetical protein